jgi:hypothetical protein
MSDVMRMYDEHCSMNSTTARVLRRQALHATHWHGQQGQQGTLLGDALTHPAATRCMGPARLQHAAHLRDVLLRDQHRRLPRHGVRHGPHLVQHPAVLASHPLGPAQLRHPVARLLGHEDGVASLRIHLLCCLAIALPNGQVVLQRQLAPCQVLCSRRRGRCAWGVVPGRGGSCKHLVMMNAAAAAEPFGQKMQGGWLDVMTAHMSMMLTCEGLLSEDVTQLPVLVQRADRGWLHVIPWVLPPPCHAPAAAPASGHAAAAAAALRRNVQLCATVCNCTCAVAALTVEVLQAARVGCQQRAAAVEQELEHGVVVAHLHHALVVRADAAVHLQDRSRPGLAWCTHVLQLMHVYRSAAQLCVLLIWLLNTDMPRASALVRHH